MKIVADLLGLSDEQKAAVIDGGRDLLVSAGAGTGKTRVLTARYLTLVLERGYRPTQVAAITFTNKAAAEMRERIRRGLRGLAGDFPAAAEALADLDWAPIQTIHSFCGEMLRALPLSAGVPPGFCVLEEAEAGLLLAEACDRVLAEALGGEEEPPGLDGLLLAFGRRGLLDLMAGTFQALSRHGLRAEDGRGDPGVIRRLEPARAALLAWWDELLACPPPPATAHGTLAALAGLRELGEGVRAAILGATPAEADPLLGELPGMLGGLRAGQAGELARRGRDLLLEFAEVRTGARAESLLPGFLALVGAAAAHYRRAKDERGALDFADLEIAARGLLANGEARLALQRRYRVLLVDEFQDTNPLQWAIIDALRQGPGGCGLFAVGDAKQSIYRFRGADIRVMQNYRRELEQGGGRVYSLTENYRCAPALAALTNHVCGPLLSPNVIYEPLRPMRIDACARPRIEVFIAPGKELQRGIEAAFIARRLAAMLAAGEEIADPDGGGARAARPGDIALLFRAATDLGEYERALRAAGLPYRVLAGSGFYRRPEIADLLSLLAAVEDGGDGAALAAALRSPLFGVSDAGLFRAAGGEGLARGFEAADFSQAVFGADGPRLQRAREVIGGLRARRHLLGLDAILAEAVAVTGYRALQAAFPDYRQRLANLEKLLDAAGVYTAGGRGEPGEFLGYLKALEGLEARESEAGLAGGDAVLLMTVHRAKGLEFPVVVLPDLGRGLAARMPDVLADETGRIGFRFGPRKEGLATPAWGSIADEAAAAEDAEACRLLYVAMTRARDRLILVGSGPGVESTWLGRLRAGIPLPAEGGEIAFPGGSLTFSTGPVAGPEAPKRTSLSERYPEIGRGEPLGVAVEAAAGGERESGLHPIQAQRTPVLTVSAALVFRACPRRYYLRHRLGCPEERAGGTARGTVHGGAELGTLLHELAAAMLAGKDNRAAIREIVRRPALDGPEEGVLDRLLLNFKQSASFIRVQAAEAVHSEYQFHLDLPGGGLVGACDLVWLDRNGHAHMADLKTNRVEAPPAALAAEHGFQLQLYALALRRVFAAVASARLEYLWPGRGIEVPVDDTTLARAEAELAAMLGFIGTHGAYDDYPAAAGQACRHCGYRGAACEAACEL
ncbi:MAG: UvrD-helicase domain-containing protein [Patescibacteria group bacterium]